MCDTCGCGDPVVTTLGIHEKILAENDRHARHNREHFSERGILTVNLMGSPGSGKTALLESTAGLLIGLRRVAAISGDLATEWDADRLRTAGIPSSAITTGSACHLDAEMVHKALHHFPLEEVDWLFIENVGNLVCPAVYDLGQTVNVVALSVTEGEDKPLKYPVMFRKADLVLLTKTDLLPHLPGYSVPAVEDALSRVMPDPKLIPVSARSLEGISVWVDWLMNLRVKKTEPKPHSH